ncbi:MAG TPA: glucodextranase DOMON-like domain-containing protein [Candidatus Rifleibacterium sp.]|nr:glucodextranase DOMON-like domain-containing protein [Candidatus Rifleibacterium sp.]HPT44887.1 glucodextranase DOMON-like domain-containing protein [Candidatus Rifleibacterium sp.]
MKTNLEKLLLLAVCLVVLTGAATPAFAQKVNYYYETGSWLDIKDNTGDDKGPGYYLYPSDKRMRRGVFDIKKFTVYEEGQVVVFEIQMRNYIMREWPDTAKSEDQGFVANLWDIYIDIDGIENSGYKRALPGRDLEFADNKGWEKMILISPLSEYELYDILRDKTDELSFQNQVDDIVYPDYVKVQSDKVIIKISKLKLPRISENAGYQCLAMGYKKIVSPNRLLNRDVRAFASFDDFGGGHDTYGDPPVMDMIVPEGDDQYALLRNYRSEPYREDIVYAKVPFVYKDGQRQSPSIARPPVKPPTDAENILVDSAPPKAVIAPEKPAAVLRTAPPVITQQAVPVKKPAAGGFVPLKPVPSKTGFKPLPKAPDGFIPVKKSK